MADALVERRPTARFFCHGCNIEFEDVLQDYTCPYCAGGFIEQIENGSRSSTASTVDFNDADMSNLDDSEDNQSTSHPMLNDLAFLVSAGNLRRMAGNNSGGIGNPTAAPRSESMFEHLVWTIGDNLGGALGAGAVTAGAPFVLVGTPGDYVFGGEGLDAVVTQLLGQLENTGPPPLPRDQIAAIPSEEVTSEHPAANTSCSVCWENFMEGERISRLECSHVFHSSCIEPWLRLHATCPICRRSLLPEGEAAAAAQGPETRARVRLLRNTRTPLPLRAPRLVLRRISRRARPPPDSASSLSSSSTPDTASSTPSATASSASSASLNSTMDVERHYNMDIDYD